MNDLRTAAQQALEAMEKATRFMSDKDYRKLNESIDVLKAALAEPTPYGCHIDIEEGIEPDGCVLDENKPEHCVYATHLLREGKGKEACEYWRPIEVKRSLGASAQTHQNAREGADQALGVAWVCPESPTRRYARSGHCEDCGKPLILVR